jgi:mRNA-degrading endonuclease RelE of RelBE toxin-antitoxin system
MPRYRLDCHVTAKRELDGLTDAERQRLVDTLTEVAETRKPTSHESVRMLEGQPGLFRVRAGDCRAICSLEKPALLVLRCGHRSSVYENVDEIDDRLADAVVA